MHGAGWWGYISSSGEKPRVTMVLLRRVLAYGRPYRGQISGMLVCIFLSTGLSLLSPLVLRTLIDQTIPNRDLTQLGLLAVVLLLIPVANGIITVIQRRLNSTVGEGVIYDLRVALFSRLQHMSLRFFTNTKVGELMSRLNNDVIGAQNAISNTLVGIITNLIQAAALTVVMLGLEWRLTLSSVLILPLFFLVARRMGGRLREIARQGMELNALMNAMMNETLNIGGALLVKLFGRSRVEVERFQSRAGEVRDIGIRRAVLGTSFFVIIGLVSAVGSALVYSLGAYLVIREVFTIGTIVAFGSYLTNLYSALSGLANAPVEFATSMVSFERVFEVIDLPAEIEEQPNAYVLTDVRGRLEFNDVSFRYDPADLVLLSEVKRFGQVDRVMSALSSGKPSNGGGDKDEKLATEKATPAEITAPAGAPISTGQPDLSQLHADDEEDHPTRSQARLDALDDISFTVEPGQLVALVGPSGAGKTTLTYLIPRLYDPTSGTISIDGHYLSEVTLESLSNAIGMVTQETHLFHDTIRTNLLYARLDATQDELEAACRAANIHDFITGLPNNYDTVVGERGYRLSGGEKQRLALARVILKDPSLLVLDEATSHLDSESEALIQEALKHVMAGRTSIVIAHRLSTILSADQILVMDRGRIVERGRHEELLAMDGLYASLYQTQFNRGTDSTAR